jgi:hypothetical protein
MNSKGDIYELEVPSKKKVKPKKIKNYRKRWLRRRRTFWRKYRKKW